MTVWDMDSPLREMCTRSFGQDVSVVLISDARSNANLVPKHKKRLNRLFSACILPVRANRCQISWQGGGNLKAKTRTMLHSLKMAHNDREKQAD